MKPERIIVVLASALLVAGFGFWATGGAAALRAVSMWLWLAAFGVLSLPLALWLVDAVWRAIRR